MIKKFELQQQRAKLFKTGREYVERSEGEQRDMSAEEKASFDKVMSDVAALDARISAIEKVESAEVEEPVDEVKSRSIPKMPLETRDVRNVCREDTAEYRDAWSKIMFAEKPQQALAEMRDISAGTTTTGGFLITPTAVITDLVKQVDNLCFIRNMATQHTIDSSVAGGIPLMTTRMAAPDWTSEVASISADTSTVFARRDLTPHVLSKLAKVSIQHLKLVKQAQQNVMNELAYQFATTLENSYLNGSGSGQSLGLFTASASGVPTSRDVDTGSTTGITADSLFTAKYSIKQPYLQDKSKVGWIFHRTGMNKIAVLKDSQNRYLLNPGLNGEPDNLLGYPVMLSEYCPSTFTAGLYVGMLGNYSYYATGELVGGLSIDRMDELYRGTNQIGFIGLGYFDGQPFSVGGESFARLITSAS